MGEYCRVTSSPSTVHICCLLDRFFERPVFLNILWKASEVPKYLFFPLYINIKKDCSGHNVYWAQVKMKNATVSRRKKQIPPLTLGAFEKASMNSEILHPNIQASRLNMQNFSSNKQSCGFPTASLSWSLLRKHNQIDSNVTFLFFKVF